jgi:hypothetical protein
VLDVGGLPHADSRISATMGAKRPNRFVTAVFDG